MDEKGNLKPAALIAARLAGKAPAEEDMDPTADSAAPAPENMGLKAAASELIAALGGPHGASVDKVMEALKNAMSCAQEDEGSEEPQ